MHGKSCVGELASCVVVFVPILLSGLSVPHAWGWRQAQGACESARGLTRTRAARKFGLPTTFGLCNGVDDCIVHLFCMYCASHQVIYPSHKM